MDTTTAMPVLRLEHISKAFGSVRAVKDVSLELEAGSVLALMGENGAGKSTIVSMILGRLAPDGGRILIRGAEADRYNPAEARRHGIRAVLQDFSLIPSLSVAANMFLGRERTRAGLLSRNSMRRTTRERLNRVGATHIDPDIEVASLSRAEQQLVEIAKAVDGEPGVLLLDEPTASISEAESERLFRLIASLKEDGWAILYISHRMDELARVADAVTVIRDGLWISTTSLEASTPAGIVHDMVGRELTEIYPPRPADPARGDVVLQIDDLATADRRVRNVSLTVRAGEIVGIGGLVGCGKREVGNVFFGLARLAHGSISVGGTRVARPSASWSARNGIGFIPEDRKREANVTGRSVAENIVLEVLAERRFSPFGWLRPARISAFAQELVEQLDVRPRDASTAVDALSGGNQQKVVLARALSRPRRLLVLIEPTAGVDVGARADIYRSVRALADGGAAVLMISSDVDELTGLSDRVYVMHEGCVTAELLSESLSSDAIVAAAFADAGGVPSTYESSAHV